jgi:hypothetical protein
MKLSALIRGLADLALSRPQPLERQPLKVGDRLEGRVLALLPERRVRIDFGRFRVLAEVHFPVRAGERLPVEVQATGPRLQLRLLPSGPTAPSGAAPPPSAASPAAGAERGALFNARLEQCETPQLSRLRLEIEKLLSAHRAADGAARSLPPPVVRALQAVAGHLQPLDPSASDTRGLSQELKTFFENSGPLFEARLAKALRLDPPECGAGSERLRPDPPASPGEIIRRDLKPNLLLLREHFQASEPSSSETAVAPGPPEAVQEPPSLRLEVARLLEGIERQQAEALDGWRAGEPLAVFSQPIPLPENGMRADMRLSVLRRAAGQEQEAGRLSLLLEMSRLGDLRADLALEGRHLTVTFYVSEERVGRLMQGALAELEKPLAGFFDSLGLRVLLSREKIAALRDDPFHASGDGVDLRA